MRSNGLFLCAGSALCFVMAAAPARAQTESVIYSFPGAASNSLPVGNLVIDQNGNLFGTARGFFVNATSGYTAPGALDFELSPPASVGAAWSEATIYAFTSNKFGVPQGDLAIDSHGDLFATATFGPAFGSGGSCYSYKHHRYGCGQFYELKAPSATAPFYTAETHFKFQLSVPGSSADTGVTPNGGLISDGHGGFYGTTSQGGMYYATGTGGYGGTVFHMTPPSRSVHHWTETVLHSFCAQDGCPDGDQPMGKLAMDAQGALYGSTVDGGAASCTATQYLGCGVVYKLTPPASTGGAWTYTVLHQFLGGAGDGAGAFGGVAVDPSGNVYGTTAFGGNSACTTGNTTGCGVVYELSPPATAGAGWSATLPHIFLGGSDGINPQGDLTLDAAGALYGVTPLGGNGVGTVYKLVLAAGAWSKAWTYSFVAGGVDAQGPAGGVILGNDGSTLYGNASNGGAYGYGAVYQITQ